MWRFQSLISQDSFSKQLDCLARTQQIQCLYLFKLKLGHIVIKPSGVLEKLEKFDVTVVSIYKTIIFPQKISSHRTFLSF